MNESIQNSDDRNRLVKLKSTITQSQIKAALSVNSELIDQVILESGTSNCRKAGKCILGENGFIEQLSKDLKEEFPEMKGFSKRDIELIRQWYLFYNEGFVITKLVVSQLKTDGINKNTIGILLCKNKNNVVVDFALKDVNKPIGVRNFTYKELSLGIKNALPTIEQLTEQLTKE